MFDEMVQNVGVIVINGRLDASNYVELMMQYEKHVIDGKKCFIVDLSQSDFIDSTGLSTLVSIYKEVKGAGGRILIVSPQHPSAMNILQITRFDQVFYMVETLAKGVQLLHSEDEGET